MSLSCSQQESSLPIESGLVRDLFKFNSQLIIVLITVCCVLVSLVFGDFSLFLFLAFVCFLEHCVSMSFFNALRSCLLLFGIGFVR